MISPLSSTPVSTALVSTALVSTDLVPTDLASADLASFEKWEGKEEHGSPATAPLISSSASLSLSSPSLPSSSSSSSSIPSFWDKTVRRYKILENGEMITLQAIHTGLNRSQMMAVFIEAENVAACLISKNLWNTAQAFTCSACPGILFEVVTKDRGRKNFTIHLLTKKYLGRGIVSIVEELFSLTAARCYALKRTHDFTFHTALLAEVEIYKKFPPAFKEIPNVLQAPRVIYYLSTSETQKPSPIALRYKCIPGDTLEKWVNHAFTAKIAYASRLSMTEKLVKTLIKLEEIGVDHQDLRPKNIILSPLGTDFEVNIVDFGCARIYDPKNEVLDSSVVVSLLKNFFNYRQEKAGSELAWLNCRPRTSGTVNPITLPTLGELLQQWRHLNENSPLA